VPINRTHQITVLVVAAHPTRSLCRAVWKIHLIRACRSDVEVFIVAAQSASSPLDLTDKVLLPLIAILATSVGLWLVNSSRRQMTLKLAETRRDAYQRLWEITGYASDKPETLRDDPRNRREQ
jgi:hypothetical protein